MCRWPLFLSHYIHNDFSLVDCRITHRLAAMNPGYIFTTTSIATDHPKSRDPNPPVIPMTTTRNPTTARLASPDGPTLLSSAIKTAGTLRRCFVLLADLHHRYDLHDLHYRYDRHRLDRLPDRRLAYPPYDLYYRHRLYHRPNRRLRHLTPFILSVSSIENHEHVEP
jgi:hypothetical protein